LLIVPGRRRREFRGFANGDARGEERVAEKDQAGSLE
jgi:hypothetical protein